ncbi:hypothetical protein MR810_08215 [bacterium]|nr:hypothetical protein [bacterium]
MNIRKGKTIFCFALCLTFLLSTACKAPAPAEMPAPQTETPAAETPAPTPTAAPAPQTAESSETREYDHKYFFVQCEKDPTREDTRHTWKVDHPVQSPDPAWSEEWDGDTVTYSETICTH